MRVKKRKRIKWEKAPDVKNKILHLTKVLDMDWIDTSKIHCYRSYGSKARAYARVWGLTRIWQIALRESPNYIIEVLSENFDKLESSEKDKVIIHELLHIPKNFSGSLVPHIKRGKRKFNDKIREMYIKYLKRK